MNMHSLPFSRLTVLAVFGLCIWASGCIREIDFDTPDDAPVLVVDGKIHAGPGPYVVEMSFSSPFGRERITPITDAKLELIDGEGNRESFFHNGLTPGTYVCAGEDIQGVIGGTYHIEGELADGTMFQSLPETIPFATNISELDYNFRTVRSLNSIGIVREETFVAVEVATQFPLLKEGPYIRWETDELWILREVDQGNPLVAPKTCYITETSDPQRVDVFNGQALKTSFWDQQEVIFRPLDFTFKDLHYFNVYQITTSAAALEYWERLERVANQQGSIFDAPPAAIRGNIRLEDEPQTLVLGYFESVTIDTARVFTTPADVPDLTRVPGYCDFRGGFANYQLPEACFECLLYPEATLERPDYLD